MKPNTVNYKSEFDRVVYNKSSFVEYFDKMNLIKLDGRFCSDELREIAKTMDRLFKGEDLDSLEVSRIKSLNIKGITAKDIKVQWYKYNKSYAYSFYVMKDGEDYDFYYGKSDQYAGDWWPEPEDEMYLSPIHEFVPDGFSGCCENMYEYRRGNLKEALGLFKRLGYTVYRGEDL